jgi:hypothetical protein
MQSLKIPRLAIIEIEDKYNRAKEKDRDRRLMIYALTEVQVLKSLGALISTFPLASSFSADFRGAEGGHHSFIGWLSLVFPPEGMQLQETRGRHRRSKPSSSWILSLGQGSLFTWQLLSLKQGQLTSNHV